MKGDLKLRREIAARPAVKPSGHLPIAQIWVDSSVYHLDSPYSYLVPGNLDSNVVVGSSVVVPFNGREVEGVVIDRVGGEPGQGLKSITKVIGSIPLLSSEVLNLIAALAERYAAHPFDIIRSAIPERAISVEREFEFHSESSRVNLGAPKRQFLQLPPATDRSALIATKIKALAANGGVLCILPDTRELEFLRNALLALGVAHAELDSHQGKSDRYRNFLAIRTGEVSVVIGTRSAIFAPLPNLSSILIYNDNSEHLYERRAPGWNVRDVALLRSTQSGADLFFVGYSPSTNLARMIENGSLDYKKARAKTRVSVIPQIHGELLPSRALTEIKKALKSGPVLFLAPLKGYAQAIRCSKCGTISRCQCGGAHQQKSERAPITCNHCLTNVGQWQCSWCHSLRPSLISRGVDRHHHEIGLLLPGATIKVSSADHPLVEPISEGVVLATPGMAPPSVAGYSGIVILEGNRFLTQPDLRSQERVREMFFAHAAMARDGAPVLLIQDEGNSISTALSTWNPMTLIGRELEERKSLNLPPYVKSASLTMDSGEIIKLKNALHVAQSEGRIPASTNILGPITEGEKSRLIITASVDEGDLLIGALHEFMRRRSTAKKSMPSLRIDPYSLSH